MALVIKSEKHENGKTEENKQNQQKSMHMRVQVRSRQVQSLYPCQSLLTRSRGIPTLLDKSPGSKLRH